MAINISQLRLLAYAAGNFVSRRRAWYLSWPRIASAHHCWLWSYLLSIVEDIVNCFQKRKANCFQKNKTHFEACHCGNSNLVSVLKASIPSRF